MAPPTASYKARREKNLHIPIRQELSRYLIGVSVMALVDLQDQDEAYFYWYMQRQLEGLELQSLYYASATGLYL